MISLAQEKKVKQPITLTLSRRKKLERMAAAAQCSMNDVIVKMIDEAPDPKQIKKAIQE